MHLSVAATLGGCFAHKELISLLGEGGEADVPGAHRTQQVCLSGGVMALQRVCCPLSSAVRTLGLPEGSSGFIRSCAEGPCKPQCHVTLCSWCVSTVLELCLISSWKNNDNWKTISYYVILK